MMSRNQLRQRQRIIRLLALGIMILGMMCILLALISIYQQSTSMKDAMKAISYDESENFKILYPQLSQVTPSSLMEKSQFQPTPDSAIKSILLSEGDIIGSLMIPSLDMTLHIFEGTDETTLKKGVGHFSQSVLPGSLDNCVLSGHRDTVFSELGKVEIGDLLIIDTASGNFTYKVTHLRIVESDDRTIIIPTDHSVLTLTTCYPFQFIGNASQRYIVSADLIIEK